MLSYTQNTNKTELDRSNGPVSAIDKDRREGKWSLLFEINDITGSQSRQILSVTIETNMDKSDERRNQH